MRVQTESIIVAGRLVDSHGAAVYRSLGIAHLSSLWFQCDTDAEALQPLTRFLALEESAMLL